MVVTEWYAHEVAQIGERKRCQEGSRYGAPCLLECTQERVAGIVHAICAVGGADAAFVELLVVGHEWQVSYPPVYVAPHFVECAGILYIGHGYAVDVTGEMAEYVIGFGVDEFVETVVDAAVHDLDRTYGADRTWLVVGCLYVYGYEVIHLISVACL